MLLYFYVFILPYNILINYYTMQADLKFKHWSAIADVGYWTTLAKKKLE
jgi:hypothetical protein